MIIFLIWYFFCSHFCVFRLITQCRLIKRSLTGATQLQQQWIIAFSSDFATTKCWRLLWKLQWKANDYQEKENCSSGELPMQRRYIKLKISAMNLFTMIMLQGCSSALRSLDIMMVMCVHVAASSNADLPESVLTHLYPIGAMDLCLTAMSVFWLHCFSLSNTAWQL